MTREKTQSRVSDVMTTILGILGFMFATLLFCEVVVDFINQPSIIIGVITIGTGLIIGVLGFSIFFAVKSFVPKKMSDKS